MKQSRFRGFFYCKNMATTYSQLEPIVSTLLTNVSSYDIIFYQFMLFNSRVGLRWSEFNPDLWSIDEQGNIRVQALKNGMLRTVPIYEDTPLVYDSMLNGLRLSSYKYDQARRTLQRCLLPYVLQFNQKDLDTHVFRHYVAKKLYSEGQSISQISEFLGQRKPTMSAHYVNSTINIITI